MGEMEIQMQMMQQQMYEANLARESLQQCLTNGLIKEVAPGQFGPATPQTSKKKIEPTILENFEHKENVSTNNRRHAQRFGLKEKRERSKNGCDLAPS